jgi:hypothetical protein
MPYTVKEVRVIYDRGATHDLGHHIYREPFQLQYAVGDEQDFVPVLGRKLKDYDQFKTHLANAAG